MLAAQSALSATFPSSLGTGGVPPSHLLSQAANPRIATLFQDTSSSASGVSGLGQLDNRSMHQFLKMSSPSFLKGGSSQQQQQQQQQQVVQNQFGMNGTANTDFQPQDLFARLQGAGGQQSQSNGSGESKGGDPSDVFRSAQYQAALASHSEMAIRRFSDEDLDEDEF